MNNLTEIYRRLRAPVNGRQTPANRCFREARTIAEWQVAERAGLVMLTAEPDEDDYWSIYGQAEDEREERFINHLIETWGCHFVQSHVFIDGKWEVADTIGMRIYEHPCSPFENDYVVDLMRTALELIHQPGEA